ncbi:hypothetical protein D6833_12480 [Candidatus Parcubacteria bacterium]|nr:MAG: hypothetical protein D6833_12480 [Candidatus Parcubacteria bacterium]
MNPLAILALIAGQKERVVWVLVALGLLIWTWNTASEVGELKARVQYQEQAIDLLSKELEACNGST